MIIPKKNLDLVQIGKTLEQLDKKTLIEMYVQLLRDHEVIYDGLLKMDGWTKNEVN